MAQIQASSSSAAQAQPDSSPLSMITLAFAASFRLTSAGMPALQDASAVLCHKIVLTA